MDLRLKSCQHQEFSLVIDVFCVQNSCDFVLLLLSQVQIVSIAYLFINIIIIFMGNAGLTKVTVTTSLIFITFELV